MPKFLASDRKGRPIAILLAEAADHADLYGLRKLANFRRVDAIPDDYEATADTSLRESFAALGMSDAGSRLAAQGREDGAAQLRVIRVPNQESSPAFRRPGSATRSDLAGAISRGDAAAVQRLALHASRQAPATRPSSEHRPAAESDEQVAVDLTEAFQDLGLSDAAAKLAAGRD